MDLIVGFLAERLGSTRPEAKRLGGFLTILRNF